MSSFQMFSDFGLRFLDPRRIYFGEFLSVPVNKTTPFYSFCHISFKFTVTNVQLPLFFSQTKNRVQAYTLAHKKLIELQFHNCKMTALKFFCNWWALARFFGKGICQRLNLWEGQSLILFFPFFTVRSLLFGKVFLGFGNNQLQLPCCAHRFLSSLLAHSFQVTNCLMLLFFKFQFSNGWNSRAGWEGRAKKQRFSSQPNVDGFVYSDIFCR